MTLYSRFILLLLATAACFASGVTAKQDLIKVREDPFKERCDPNWKQTRREFKINLRKVWKNPQCYDFVFERSCFCMIEYLGPFKVQVRNGVVVEPTDMNVPTINEMFEMINRDCIAGCPNDGAVVCNVDYGVDGNVDQLYIDRSAFIADEETHYTVSDFQICDD